MVSPSSTASTASENKSEKGVWFSLRYRFESLRFAATFLKPCRISRSWDGSKHLAMTVFINAAVITTERREKIGGGGIITSTMIDVFWARNRGTSSPTPVHPRFNEREIKPGYSEELAIFYFFSKECFRRSGPRRSAEAFSRSRASNTSTAKKSRLPTNIAAKYRTISRDRDFAISNEPESCIAKFSQEAARASVFSRKDHKTTLWNPVVWLERFKKKKKNETNKNLQIEQQKALGLCPVVFFKKNFLF